MKIMTVVGARPQFIKAAAITAALKRNTAFRGVENVLVHSGQHHDQQMSDVFFSELDIEPPSYNLRVNGGGHGEMTGRMLEAMEPVMLDERPDWVLVYGDTNTTLAAGLVAAKLHIKVAHVEAGLRSYNRRMPEEINRVLVDHLSTRLYCPSQRAVDNLSREGVRSGVYQVGDVMYDISQLMTERMPAAGDPLTRLSLRPKDYILATIHRAENTNDISKLRSVMKGLAELAKSHRVVLPLHPRTRSVTAHAEFASLLEDILVIEPLGFLDMLHLEKGAKSIVTDSGGVQKEAYFYGVPCVTTRDETEWVETVETGWNRLVGSNADRIVEAVEEFRVPAVRPLVYGAGDAADRILRNMLEATN